MIKMNMNLFILLLTFILTLIIQSIIALPIENASGCEIDPFESTPTPILLRNDEFIYPASSSETALKFDSKETIDIACPGGYILTNGKSTKLSLTSLTCVSGTKFSINNETYSYKEIKCSKNPVSDIRFTGSLCQPNNLTELVIGFEISETIFARSELICFNDSTLAAMYTTTSIPASINSQVKNNPRPSWRQGDDVYLDIDVDAYYKRNKQRSTINKLLGLSSDDTKYIQDNNDYFLSRGHLIARTDLYYAAQQNSTFYLENVLPQWQTFNGGNWNEVEISIRDYAEDRNVNLTVWSGGYGITTLPHKSTGEEIPLFLYTEENEQLIPVPEIYWKIVYHNETKQGVVLIGVNNPYKSLEQINQFCDDQSEVLSWLSWTPKDQKKGFSWACAVDDFRQTVDFVPDIDVFSILI